MLTGVTSPPCITSPPHNTSPELQYPKNDNEEGQWTLTHSPPLLMIPLQSEEVECILTPPPPISPLPPYATLPYANTNIPSLPSTPPLMIAIPSLHQQMTG
jgi:hypothetical protein